MARGESRLDEHRGHERLRAEGGGPIHQLVFANQVIAALVILRCRLPNTALAVFYGVDRSAVTRAVHEVRPLLAARRFADPGEAALRLRTPADVFAYAAAKGVELRLDGTEVRVRRPKAGRAGRRAFTSAHDSPTRSPLPRRSLSQRICVKHANAEHKQWRPSSGTSSAVSTTRKPIWPSRQHGLRPHRRAVISCSLLLQSIVNDPVVLQDTPSDPRGAPDALLHMIDQWERDNVAVRLDQDEKHPPHPHRDRPQDGSSAPTSAGPPTAASILIRGRGARISTAHSSRPRPPWSSRHRTTGTVALRPGAGMPTSRLFTSTRAREASSADGSRGRQRRRIATRRAQWRV